MYNHTQILTIKDLANYLRCEVCDLEEILRKKFFIREFRSKKIDEIIHPSLDLHDFFYDCVDESKITIHKFYIPKKNVSLGYREVYSVKSHKLSNILKTINSELKSIYIPNKAIHGFVEERNIKSNATVHLAKKYLLSVDIKHFFESVTKQMVGDSLIKLGYSELIATYLSEISTLNGILVQGYNTSPTLANIVAEEMDQDFLKLCSDKIDYTRYADDIYFSSDSFLPDLSEINEIVKKHGFELNENKTKFMNRGGKQFVTGLSVFDNKYPRIPKRIKRNLRLEIYYIKKRGMKAHILKKMGYSFTEYKNSIEIRSIVDAEIQLSYNRINGWLLYIKSIEPNCANKMIRELHKKKLDSFYLSSPKTM